MTGLKEPEVNGIIVDTEEESVFGPVAILRRAYGASMARLRRRTRWRPTLASRTFQTRARRFRLSGNRDHQEDLR